MSGSSVTSRFPRTAKRFRHVVHAPYYVRALVRSNEIWLTGLAGCVGVLAGLSVWVVTRATLWAHRVLYALQNDGRLSGLESLDPVRTLLVPTLGGLVLGLFGLFLSRHFSHRPVDPVEANALHGGRMSLRDSAIVAFQTFLSNGCGASLGLEAGFSQIAAAFGSRAGLLFRVRRADLRILVGCGAGGAIGAAFDAPIAGSFYAFELVIGTYSLVNLAPVALASITAIGTVRLLGGVTASLALPAHGALAAGDVATVTGIGIGCGLLGIAVMRGVTIAEAVFRRTGAPAVLRPVLGGALVGGLALYSPSILSAGHAAATKVLAGGVPLQTLAVLLLFKALASCISIGSGFRGGLFFASLYLGVLAGSLMAAIPGALWSGALPPPTCAVLGMSAMAVAIIGVPMTMTCLILEMTADLTLASGVLLASILSLLTVRRLFGYSFATWRFHQRGETIRSAVDVSWLRRLSVRRMMQEPVTLYPPEMPLSRARQLCPPGHAPQIVLGDSDRRYRGIVLVPDIHLPGTPPDRPLAALAQNEGTMLLPGMDIRDAARAFEQAETDALVVVDSLETRHVIGLLTERYVLRRYAEALDRTRRELAGETRRDLCTGRPS
ncbi:chloride channel protein [Swaminathania salitolerans]|uniref:chloride channel protein n=1 Tax=Swaminathania salitolerans TaxID=182838 RepID=UPI0011BDA97C|nr:chloride channel protein [Swaminathania salitolerans]